MNRQIQSRQAGEYRARGTLLRLWCAASIWRTLMTRVLPLCGTASWWTGLICLLPGFLAAALWRLILHVTGTSTLAEALRACWGGVGAVFGAVFLAVPLLLDGTASVTALITLFTQGVGTRGTQLTLALLTGGALLLSLHREGLARGAYFLRWGMAAAAGVMAAFALAGAEADHLFPLYGDGASSVATALQAGGSLAWPVVVLLTLRPSAGQGRRRSGILPAFAAVGAVVLLCLAVPHELLIRQEGLASLLLLPVRYVPNAVRVLGLCLMMLTFFLAIGAAAQQATDHLCMPWKHTPAWLPYGVLAALFFTQAGNISRLWRWLGMAEPWLLLPLAALALVSLPVAYLRRKRL